MRDFNPSQPHPRRGVAQLHAKFLADAAVADPVRDLGHRHQIRRQRRGLPAQREYSPDHAEQAVGAAIREVARRGAAAEMRQGAVVLADGGNLN